MKIFTTRENLHEFSRFTISLNSLFNAAFDKRVSLTGIAARPNEVSTGMDLH